MIYKRLFYMSAALNEQFGLAPISGRFMTNGNFLKKIVYTTNIYIVMYV